MQDEAIIVNVKGSIKINKKRFNGLNVNDYEIDFRDDNKNNKAFDNCATEYPDKISFNKLRYDTIDCTKNGHLEKLFDF